MKFKKIKSMSMKRSVLLSSLLHVTPLLIMLFFVGTGVNKYSANSKNSNNENKILEKPVDLVEVEVIKVKGKDRPKQSKSNNDKCPNSFGGIGIRSNNAGIIIEVVKGYPAYNAGIKEGDILITNMDSVRGEVGTEVEIQYVSSEDAIVHYVILTREKICVESSK